MDLGLAGKRALITGGASGMGAELARTLVAEGAKVCINYRSRKEEADALVAELGADNCVAVKADLAVRSDVDELFEDAVTALGGLDILVNNAGLWLDCAVGGITDDQWDRSMEVNLRAPMWLSQHFVNHCLGQGRKGRILNVTSQAAFSGSSTGHIPYAIGKAGLVAMTRSMVREMGPNGITVNALAIGTMESPMIAQALDKKRAYYESRIPVGYIATPHDVATVAAFLVSERSTYMSGATVDVSGGQLRH
ncbi:SDR family oxidoreductase [Actinomycetaceae bacterium L2_0104]